MEAGILAARLRRFLTQTSTGDDVSNLRLVSHRWQVRLVRFRLHRQGTPLDAVLSLYEGDRAAWRCEVEAGLATNLSAQGLAVPTLLAYSADPVFLGYPFQIVRHVAGRTLAQELAVASAAQRVQGIDRFASLLARLHQLPVSQVMPRAMRDVQVPSDQHFARLRTEARRVLLDTHHLLEFEPVLAWIDASVRGLRWSEAVLAHNDYHPGNVLCGPDGVDRLIDWATVDASDSRYDLGWTLMLASTYWGPEASDAVMRAYRRACGRSVDAIEVFVLIAALRRMLLRGLPVHAARRKLGMPGRALINEPTEAAHLRSVCALVSRITGLRLPSVERVLDGL